MATTTNYGWDTPDDTDLVKDGAAAIRTLGSSVDTTTKALNPSTTLGDIEYRSATANTNTRLAIGTTGQVLKVTGGVPAWGAGAGQLTETVFTSSDASWTIPTGVTGVWALVVGGGGGGGASSTSTAQNGGGGGGAGRVLETFFAISGDTTLNITVGAGGAGATTSGTQGSTGSASTIVGNTTSTTYASGAGGGGGGGGTTTAGLTGASGGGVGRTDTQDGSGGGGGNKGSANTQLSGFWASSGWSTGGGGAATTRSITGGTGGGSNVFYGGQGIYIWGQALAGGGNAPGKSANTLSTLYGAVSSTAINTDAANATANTGAGGNGASTTTTTKYNGGNGGSGLVVLRYIV